MPGVKWWFMFEYVEQKDKKGCGVACLAMVSNKSYDYVCKFFSGKDFEKDGLGYHDLIEYLVEHNFSINWKFKTYQAKGLNGERKKWPPELWTDINIISVLQPSNVYHYIVVIKRVCGHMVYDPYSVGINSLDEYKEVSQVIEIYKNV